MDLAQRTPLHDQHVALGARIVDFHGWELPVQYEGILAEHAHCRSAACVFDTSHMGQVLIQAPPSSLNRVTTQNADALAIGSARYGFLLNERGGILDDTILMRLAAEEFLLVVNAGTQDDDLAWVQAGMASGDATSLSTAGWAKLDLQGPQSAAVLAPVTDADLSDLGYFRVTRTTACGRDCILSRTGYTGELGYEVFAPADALAAIFAAIVERPPVKPAGLGARDSLRLEMGYPLYGDDISVETTPREACLEHFVPLDHDFIGATALAGGEPPSCRLVAFAAETRRRAWAGDAICDGQTPVGQVTSAAFAPSLNVSIGMGYVPPALAAPGTPLTVRTRRGDLAVTVIPKPPYTHGTCRTKELGPP
jgi:aminomethyltransferase